MPVTVSGLAFTPVKGLHLRTAERLEVDERGVAGDRRFYVVDARDRMVNGKTMGELSAIVATVEGDELSLSFPDGVTVSDRVRTGAPAHTRFYSRMREDAFVDGPWSDALTEYVGQPLRLVEVTGPGSSIDRGRQGGISVISRGSLLRLAHEGGVDSIDVRRFRMSVEVDGVEAHGEDDWVGRRVRLGEVLVHFHGHVGRCLITSRDADTGIIDLPTLEMLGRYRSELQSTEPLPFGIHGEVLEAGTVALGDAVLVES